MHRRAAFFVVGGVLVVVVIALLGELLVPRMSSRVVHVGNVHDLTPGTPVQWNKQVWVVLDKRGELHAFAAMYEATPSSYGVIWLDRRDPIAAGWLARNDGCVAALGDGIFYLLSPSSSRFDAAGRRLFGADRPTLDWYDVSVDGAGNITVNLAARHRTEYPNTGSVGSGSGSPSFTATPTPAFTPTPAGC